MFRHWAISSVPCRFQSLASDGEEFLSLSIVNATGACLDYRLSAPPATQVAVRRAAGEALSSGEIILLGLGERDVRLRIRVLADGEAYLAISFRNTMEEKFMVAVLGSLVSVAADDWQVEPTSPLELPLELGEVVWSTLLSTDAQHALLTASTSR